MSTLLESDASIQIPISDTTILTIQTWVITTRILGTLGPVFIQMPMVLGVRHTVTALAVVGIQEWGGILGVDGVSL